MKIFGIRIETGVKKKWRGVPLSFSCKFTDERMEATLLPIYTPQEFGEEARADPVLLRPFGFGRRSAFSRGNREVLERRYVRHKQWTGSSPAKMLGVIRTMVFLCSLPVPIAASWAYNYYVLEPGLVDATIPIYYVVAIAFAVGVIVFGFGGMVCIHVIKYRFCYAKLVAFEQKGSMYDLLYQRQRQLERVQRSAILTDDIDDNRLSMISGRLTLRVPWLAFVDKAHLGNYYAGARGNAGFQRSEIHVQLPQTMKIHDIEEPHELYDFAPRRHEFTGNTAQYWYQLLQMFVEIGESLFREKQTGKLKKFLRDYWVFLMIGLQIIGILYLNGRASDFTLEVIDLVQRNAEITAELNE